MNVFVYVTVDHVYLPQLVTHTTIPSLGLLPGMYSITIYVCVVLPYIGMCVWYRFNAMSCSQLMHTRVRERALACASESTRLCKGKHLCVQGESYDCVSGSTCVPRVFHVYDNL